MLQLASYILINIGMNKYYNKINLPFEPLIPEYNIFSQQEPIKIIDLKFLNPKLKELFDELNVTVTFIECFYKNPLHWAEYILIQTEVILSK